MDRFLIIGCVPVVLDISTDQRNYFQKHPVDQQESPVDGPEAPFLPNAPQGCFFGIASIFINHHTQRPNFLADPVRNVTRTRALRDNLQISSGSTSVNLFKRNWGSVRF